MMDQAQALALPAAADVASSPSTMMVMMNKRRRIEKTVRFATNETTEIVSPSFQEEVSHKDSVSSDATADLWWTRLELAEIKEEAKSCGIKVRAKLRQNRSPQDSQQKKHRSRSVLMLAYIKVHLMLEKDLSALLKLTSPTTSPDQDLFQWWCTKTDGRRGLERISCKAYFTLRRQMMASVRDAIFAEQSKQRALGKTADAESIARIARRLTRNARTFALYLGEADRLAAAAH